VNANWETVASLGTAAGTLVLAIATFASVRSANQAARTAEKALLANQRPLLVSSRLQDPAQKIMFGDGHWVMLGGGRGSAQVGREDVDLDGMPSQNDSVYLTLSLRNAGTGLAVVHGWRFAPDRLRPGVPHPAPDFRAQGRDLYIAPGDTGFWQGAFRDPTDPQYDAAVKAVQTRQSLTIDLMYGDYDGGQRVQTRFTLEPRPGKPENPEEDIWIASVSLHHNVDRPDPRDLPPQVREAFG
jgi:hypothetical protein